MNREQKDLFSRYGHFSVAEVPVPPPLSGTYVGREVPKPPPHLTLDALNHPICATVELESVRVTGDRCGCPWCTNPWSITTELSSNMPARVTGLYMTDWASMDNSPRSLYEKGRHGRGYCRRWFLFGNQLAEIAELLGRGHPCQQCPIGGNRLRRSLLVVYRQVKVELPLGVPHLLVDNPHSSVASLRNATASSFFPSSSAILASWLPDKTISDEISTAVPPLFK